MSPTEFRHQREYEDFKKNFASVEQKLFNIFKVITEQLFTCKSALQDIATTDKDQSRIARQCLNKIEEIK